VGGGRKGGVGTVGLGVSLSSLRDGGYEERGSVALNGGGERSSQYRLQQQIIRGSSR